MPKDKLISFPQTLFNILDIEIFVLLAFLCLISFLFYRFLLQKVSTERHQSIQSHLKKLNRHFFVLAIFYVSYLVIFDYFDQSLFFKKLITYLAVITFLLGVALFVAVCRLLVLMYLFLGSMKAGVPLLLVNIFSLLLTIAIAIWSISHIFGVQVAPLLATSAAFSVVLGLALQDTLGNLFAGISLQVDKAFEIGDWLEVQNGINKFVGQVKELTWRATVLQGFSDEIITVPNKVMALSFISNFSPDTPIMRQQIIRLEHSSDLNLAKEIIEKAVTQLSDVRSQPAPFAYVADITESWANVKILYFIQNYGSQFVIGDKVFNVCSQSLKENGFQFAKQKIEVIQS